jgi:hypothetical protein
MQPTLIGSTQLELREATNETERGAVMRALRFEFHPEQIRISSDEILADLSYPVHKDRDQGGRKRARNARVRREAQPVS